MKKLALILCFLAAPAFAGISAVQGLPGAVAGMSGGAGKSQLACEQNCPPGDAQCLKSCKSPTAPPQQPVVPDFRCLNQCTQAGYGYDYCKTVCGR
jgi:hypothetical protein